MRFLVVSYNDDQQEFFYDTVEAETDTQAAEFICKVRPYVIAADASLPEEFSVNLSMTINGTEWDAREPLSRCQNCDAPAREQSPQEKALRGVLHHNAAIKPQYQLPASLIRQIENALEGIEP